MWTFGGKIYLGLRTDVDGRIYDVSCLSSGCQSGLGNALAIRTLDSGTTNFYVTYSLSGSTPFLYFGSDDRCGGGSQREWLFDVTNPSSPRDVSPQNNYWGWYYRGNPTGFNEIMPRTGKFVGNQFYRMALSLFDIHTWNSNGNPSPSLFINAPDSGTVNTPITFTADAAICSPNPSGYSWNPAGGTIVGSANGSSVQISWSGAGLDEVSVTNSACGTARGVHSINIVSGGNTPLVAHFNSSPNAPQPGQQVSFDASSSSGGPTDFSWSFGDGTGGAGEVTTHTYAKAGNYNLTLTISGPGTGPSCPGGICTAQTFRVIAVGQPPTPTAAFTTDLPCMNLFGFDECQVQVGHSGTFSASDSGPFTYAWEFGDGGKATGQTASHTWTTVGLVTMELAVSNGQQTVLSTKLINVTSGPPPCVESDTSLCTLTNRFQLTVNWTKPSGGGSGAGHALSLSADTGYFWFFSPSNVEMVAKVLDGCLVNHKFWVFAGGLTNVQTDLIVTDTSTGATKTYHNPQGTPFQPLQDTAAFDCGSSTAFPAAVSPETAPPSTDLQLDSGRFLVSAAWTQPGGQTGTGQGVPLTTDTGYFWFFNSANVEMVIKVLNACGVNDKYWVFAGGLTNVKVVVTVTDTSNGTVKTYTNPQGVAFAPIQDTSAFATCP
jgi:PKD repeat protein